MITGRIDDPKTNAGLRAVIIAEQNDNFRKAKCGQSVEGPVPEGMLVATTGIRAQGPMFLFQALREIGAYQDFTPDSDPYGFCEMGVIEVETLTVWWKIDLYDLKYEWGSEHPEDPEQTRRVLTIMLPSEY